MGRKHWSERPERGPGRKSRKQKDPAVAEETNKPVSAKKAREKAKKVVIENKEYDIDVDGPAFDADGLKFDEDPDAAAEGESSDAESFAELESDEDDVEEEEKEEEGAPAKKISLDLGSDEEVEQGEEEGGDEEGSSDEEEAAEEEDEESKKSILNITTGEEAELTDPTDLQDRIRACLEIIGDFKNRGEPGKKRKDYRVQLSKDLAAYYGYNDYLIQQFMDLFPDEILEFLDSNEVDRPVTIRTNTLKTRRKDLAQALIARGVNLDPIGKWSTVGVVIYDSTVPIGATPEYLAGHYMLQGGASLLPVMSLGPKPTEKILDMAAAPGGKTTHIAQLMRNTGVLIANDVSRDRQRAVSANAWRCGAVNTIVCTYDGRQLPLVYSDCDRVLLDAPCSGTGVIAKDPSAKTSKSEKDLKGLQRLQKELLVAAIDCCTAQSQAATIVYSTCSVLTEENEAVVNYALAQRHVELVETGLDFGKPGFVNFKEYKYHPTMNKCRRFYPHTHNLDGFFVAKLRKTANGPKGTEAASKMAKMGSKNVSKIAVQLAEQAKRQRVKAATHKQNVHLRKERQNERDQKHAKPTTSATPQVTTPPTAAPTVVAPPVSEKPPVQKTSTDSTAASDPSTSVKRKRKFGKGHGGKKKKTAGS